MSQAYTPGLKVGERIKHRSRRMLPLAGEVLVQIGQRVAARDVVAQSFMPGDVTPINVAHLLSISPGDVPKAMLKKEGDTLTIGEPLARTQGMFGFFKGECAAKVAGTVESISAVTGQVMVRGERHRVRVDAYLAGEVVEVIPQAGAVIEAEVTFVQGIFGIGGEAFGPIHIACTQPAQVLTPDLITPEMRGAVVVGGARVTADAIAKGVKVGVSALVTGGIDDQDLRDFLGYDLGVAVTGNERVGLTLVITEGFGDIAMADRTFRLLASRKGTEASVNGATQIRAGVMRPEVLVPWPDVRNAAGEALLGAGLLRPGASVRIIRDPYFGMIGTAGKMPSEPQVLGSGSKARVLEVKMSSGETVVVPRANVELIEG